MVHHLATTTPSFLPLPFLSTTALMVSGPLEQLTVLSFSWMFSLSLHNPPTRHPFSHATRHVCCASLMLTCFSDSFFLLFLEVMASVLVSALLSLRCMSACVVVHLVGYNYFFFWGSCVLCHHVYMWTDDRFRILLELSEGPTVPTGPSLC